MIFIPHNVPSLKNSKTIGSYVKNGEKIPTLTHSKAVKKYLQTIGIKDYRPRLNKKQIAAGKVKVEEYKAADRPNLFRKAVGNYFDGVQFPVILKFHFVRKTAADFDFTNAVDIIADLLTAHDFIPDDCMRLFVPMPMLSAGKWYSVDKKRPGVWLKIVEVGK